MEQLGGARKVLANGAVAVRLSREEALKKGLKPGMWKIIKGAKKGSTKSVLKPNLTNRRKARRAFVRAWNKRITTDCKIKKPKRAVNRTMDKKSPHKKGTRGGWRPVLTRAAKSATTKSRKCRSAVAAYTRDLRHGGKVKRSSAYFKGDGPIRYDWSIRVNSARKRNRKPRGHPRKGGKRAHALMTKVRAGKSQSGGRTSVTSPRITRRLASQKKGSKSALALMAKVRAAKSQSGGRTSVTSPRRRATSSVRRAVSPRNVNRK
jgi:hypothetical protein